MAFVEYLDIATPNELLAKMVLYATSVGWTITEGDTADLDIINDMTSDGHRATISPPGGGAFFNLRSANGYQIFPKQRLGVSIPTWKSSHLDQDGNYIPTMPTANDSMYGLGITASSAFSASAAKWYDHPDIPKYATTDNTGSVVGVGLQMIKSQTCKLICNLVPGANPVIVFTIVIGGVYQHVSIGLLQKSGTWVGGMFISGTANSYTMFTSVDTLPDLDTKMNAIESNMSIMFGTEANASTFVRIDMDEAPSRGYIVWASSGNTGVGDSVCYTGKQLALPLRTATSVTDAWCPKLPHYYYLQSKESNDQGRNSNTLNCITINMPLLACVIRDPDKLRQFSPIGYIPGIYFISLYNMQAGFSYELSYPTSGDLHQVLPFTRRAGRFGYDGFSIKQ